MLRLLVLKPHLFVSIRGPNRKTLPIDKHGNGVVCHCLKWSILMKLFYNILCILAQLTAVLLPVILLFMIVVVGICVVGIVGIGTVDKS